MTSFATSLIAGVANYPTKLDGMIVYNVGTGTAKTGATAVAVSPGFYYYENTSSNINGGTWKPLSPSSAAAVNAWALSGNTGTTANTNFMGTTDAQNVVFKSNSGNTTSGYNATKMVLGNATDTPTFTKVVIGGTAAQQASALATKTKNVKPSNQTADAPFDFAMEVYGKSWFADGLVTSNSTYPDYVFDKYFTGRSRENSKYSFLTLAQTEKYIKENNHLPGVTAISELPKENGKYMIDATQLSVQSLEKIEELYLHTIEQQKEIDTLKAELAEIKAALKK